MIPALGIVRLGPLASDPALPDWLAAALARRLPLATRVAPPLELREEWWSRRRNQCSSQRIVDALIERDGGREDAGWTLALTAADLFAPRRAFVFGEATRGGCWAVVSTARLGDTLPLLRERTLKEALHEIGHLGGLRHCRAPHCVLYPAASPAEIDRRPEAFCAACRSSFAVSSGLVAKDLSG